VKTRARFGVSWLQYVLFADRRRKAVAVAGERRKKVVVAMTTGGLRRWELGLNHKRDSEAIRLLICEIL
jgi:hypothetical protein